MVFKFGFGVLRIKPRLSLLLSTSQCATPQPGSQWRSELQGQKVAEAEEGRNGGGGEKDIYIAKTVNFCCAYFTTIEVILFLKGNCTLLFMLHHEERKKQARQGFPWEPEEGQWEFLVTPDKISHTHTCTRTQNKHRKPVWGDVLRECRQPSSLF